MSEQGIKPHYFVTGANGFVGSYLVKQLLREGKQVTAIKRTNSKMDLLAGFEDQINWKIADVNDIPSLEEAMKGCTHVFHVAAKISYLSEDAAAMMKVNVEGTANLLAVAKAMQITKFLHVSSVAAMPALEKGQLINEESAWQLAPYPSTYGLSKYLGEMEVLRAEAEGMCCVILSPSNVMGAGHWKDGTGMFFESVHKGLSFYTQGSGGFVDVRDVADCCIKLMDSTLNTGKYLCTGENQSYREVFTQIAKAMGKKAPTTPVQSWMSNMAIAGDFLKTLFTRQPRLITKESISMASVDTKYDNSKIKAALHYNFMSVEKSISETVPIYLDSVKSGRDWGVY
jgi:nucleoside-diphosphate-sugar epimerase